MMSRITLQTPILQQLDDLYPSVKVDVLRLDLVHPVISGNKWYKLQAYLEDARLKNCSAIVSFGGAWSNHILAVAAACKASGFKSYGIIRGEKPAIPSATLQNAESAGMELVFVTRKAYQEKTIPKKFTGENYYIIPEGGYGPPGTIGIAAVMRSFLQGDHTHIIASVGTGTMMAGIVKAARSGQQVLGISSMKNNTELAAAINALLPIALHNQFTIDHQYHFGGYGRQQQALFDFMNHWYRQTGIPTDIVYTGKLFYAVNDLIEKSSFPPGSRLLVVHSGGLQGNRSLPKGTLIF